MMKIIRIPCMDFILLLIKRRIWIYECAYLSIVSVLNWISSYLI